MEIGNRIKKYRKDNNLTQSEFANMLHVSKQAVSKWETNKGYPDISLYPKLAEILNADIGELLGNKKTAKKKNIKLYIPIACAVWAVIIIISVILIFININKNNKRKEIESILNIKLPPVEIYESKDFYEWSAYNSYYPDTISHYIFKDTDKLLTLENKIKTDPEWIYPLPDKQLTLLPENALFYTQNCDYIKLINLTDKRINTFPQTPGIYQFMLSCYQIDNNRLIIIQFTKEVYNEN